MMPVPLRRLIVVLSVLAFVSGMSIQAIPSAEALGLSAVAGGAKADPECPRMAIEHHSEGMPIPLPCKGIMLDCVKQMGCLGTPALPDRADAASVHHSQGMPIPLPCNGIMLDCVKQMGCLGTPALPDRAGAVSMPVAYSMVVYCAPGPALSGRDVEPDLFPPIAS